MEYAQNSNSFCEYYIDTCSDINHELPFCLGNIDYQEGQGMTLVQIAITNWNDTCSDINHELPWNSVIGDGLSGN